MAAPITSDESDSVQCAAPGCERKAGTKGLCSRHYQRQRDGRPFVVSCAQCGNDTPRPKYCSVKCRQLAGDRKRTGFSPPTQMKQCGECKEPFLPKEHRNVFCSRACGNKVRWRKATSLRRARLKSAHRERFDPFAVFERDGWRCYLCECETPRHLRGSKHPQAPELDHVVPLAQGGEHTPDNTACACRRCNMQKRDSIVDMGQWVPGPLPVMVRKPRKKRVKAAPMPKPFKGVEPLYRAFDYKVTWVGGS